VDIQQRLGGKAAITMAAGEGVDLGMGQTVLVQIAGSGEPG
jgi:hypothetical protein